MEIKTLVFSICTSETYSLRKEKMPYAYPNPNYALIRPSST